MQHHSSLFLSLGIALEILGVGTTLTSAWYLEKLDHQTQQASFENVVDRAVTAATARLTQYETVLKSGIGVYIASPLVTRESWRGFIQNLNIDYTFPGSNGFGHITRVLPENLSDFIERERADQYPSFNIKGLGPYGPEHWIIHVIEPVERNRQAVGLDVRTESRRKDAAEMAMLTGKAVITNIITLVQDEQKKPGFLMFAPHYKTVQIPDTEEARRANCIGWTYAPFVGEKILQDFLSLPNGNVTFSIYDGKVSPETQIADGSKAASSGFETRREVIVGGKPWVFVAHSTLPHPRGYISSNAQVVLIGGLTTASGLFLVLLLLHRASKNALLRAKKATQEAVQAGEAKSRFLAVVSHEIRTPLNGVIGLAELALLDPMDSTLRSRIETIQTSGKLLLSLVNDILDFSRFAAGNLPLESLPFNASHELRTVAELLKNVTEAREVPLLLDLPPSVWVLGDPLRFRQIVLNLTSNALKFTQKGSVSISLQHTHHSLSVCVKDTGIGMTQDTISRLFTPFTQADASISRQFGGTGLGLAIVKSLVDRIGGTIVVESEFGKGSSFHVTLPLPSTAPAAPPETKQPSSASFKLHILLAEDVPTNQLVASTMLKKLGCSVSIASNGHEAIEKAPGHDVILMDCSMPEMDGLEATRQLRLNGCTTPIIALTANASDEDSNICKKAGMNGFLSKPITKAALATALAPYSKNSSQNTSQPEDPSASI